MTMDRNPALLRETPSQTAGPYVHIGCTPSFVGITNMYGRDIGDRAFGPDEPGVRIIIRGKIYDGAVAVVLDAMLESWQARADGTYGVQHKTQLQADGFCRFCIDAASGEFTLHTIKPGIVSGSGGQFQAPHIALLIFARGINTALQTRIYFDDEDNDADPVLKQIEPSSRIATLLATKELAREYRFDIRLQGDNETVFLDM